MKGGALLIIGGIALYTIGVIALGWWVSWLWQHSVVVAFDGVNDISTSTGVAMVLLVSALTALTPNNFFRS